MSTGKKDDRYPNVRYEGIAPPPYNPLPDESALDTKLPLKEPIDKSSYQDTSVAITLETLKVLGMVRFLCAHCKTPFMVTTTTEPELMAKCPHCKKVSVRNKSTRTKQIAVCVVFGIMLLLSAVSFAFLACMGISEDLTNYPGVVYFLVPYFTVLGLILLIKGIHVWRTVKISYPLE